MSTTTIIVTSPGNGTFTVPIWVTSVHISALGGGGGSGTAALGEGGGGGGGRSITPTYSVTPGASISYFVGQAGTKGNAGGDTTFDTTGVVAKGGSPGIARTSGAGGQASSGTGTTKYSGGAGGQSSGGSAGGAGGGSSAGTSSDGNAGQSNNVSVGGPGGTAPTGGYAGGDGGDLALPGLVGGIGAGGGGGGATADGLAGGVGELSITYIDYESILTLGARYPILQDGFDITSVDATINDYRATRFVSDYIDPSAIRAQWKVTYDGYTLYFRTPNSTLNAPMLANTLTTLDLWLPPAYDVQIQTRHFVDGAWTGWSDSFEFTSLGYVNSYQKYEILNRPTITTPV